MFPWVYLYKEDGVLKMKYWFELLHKALGMKKGRGILVSSKKGPFTMAHTSKD